MLCIPRAYRTPTSTSSPGATLAHLHISVDPLGPQYGMATSSYKGLAPDTVVAVVVKAADSRPFSKTGHHPTTILNWQKLSLHTGFLYPMFSCLSCFAPLKLLPWSNQMLNEKSTCGFEINQKTFNSKGCASKVRARVSILIAGPTLPIFTTAGNCMRWPSASPPDSRYSAAQKWGRNTFRVSPSQKLSCTTNTPNRWKHGPLL